MTDTLHQEPERDQFKSESPIRAFTDWQVNGRYALGKGFRPSLQHVVPYLEAMERKEGWSVVQVLEAGTQTPSFLFRLEREPTVAELRERYPHLDFALPEEEPFVRNREGFEEAGHKIDQARDMTYEPKEHRVDLRKHKVDDVRALAPEGYVFDRYEGHGDEFAVFVREVTSAPPVSAIGDDPINPKRYAGRECADIGERLTANGYQILKYCWRLGKKDDPCQELGKAIWYGESEAALLKAMAHKQGYRHTTPNVTGIKDPSAFLEDRIADQPQFTQNIARMLWAGYSQRQLQAILEAINEHRFHLDCGRGLAI